MDRMKAFALGGLIALWILWFLSFAVRRVRRPEGASRKAKTARISVLGMVLQGLANAFVWSTRDFWTHPLRLWGVLLAAVFAVASLVLVWSAIPALGKQWRFQAGVYEDHVLIQTGVYGYVRHPIYASLLALLLATGLVVASLPSFAIALVLFLTGTEIRIRAEDRLLAERFGSEFEAYRARVPAYIPLLR
jgi:protein-S-isoprenylcysteine O-methyltransferase Ste14